ncbi:hypothetical protein K438DRAFT_1783607 [Mycena galopus ATCC 62051]|nr:hypothetical protein K438DRAFT_1783607 [Mycena galopus ATCC 62051]
MPQSYKLHIISVSGIQWKPQLLSFHREKPNLSVEISVDGKKVYHTSAKRDWSGMWNDISSLSVDTESAKIGFQVFHKSALKPRQCLAKIEREIDFQLKLDHADENLTQASKPELVVCMSPAKGLADAAGPLAKATENSATLHTGSAGTMVVDLVNQGAQHDDLLSALGTLVARLGNVVDIGVKIGGEIAKAVKKQKEADEKTVQLVQAMTDVFLFAEDVEKLSETLKCPRLEASISALVKLTEECAKFIEGYCKTTFWTRVTTEIWKQRSQKIDDFCTAFSKFHQDLDKGVQLHTAFVTTDLTISS